MQFIANSSAQLELFDSPTFDYSYIEYNYPDMNGDLSSIRYTYGDETFALDGSKFSFYQSANSYPDAIDADFYIGRLESVDYYYDIGQLSFGRTDMDIEMEALLILLGSDDPDYADGFASAITDQASFDEFLLSLNDLEGPPIPADVSYGPGQNGLLNALIQDYDNEPSSGDLDISIVSKDSDVVTFGVFASPSTDPDEDGIGSFDFVLSHYPSDMLIDGNSIVSGTGYSGVPNYNATTGVLITGGYALPSVTDLLVPLATFSATILDTDNPVNLTISNAIVDDVAQDDVVETFDFSSVSITTTIVDRFGDDLILQNDDVFAFEVSGGDQFFVQETDGSDTNTVFEIVANPTSELSAIDFDLTDYSGLTDFTLSDVLSNWTFQTNETVTDQVSFSGFSNNSEIPAGQETVLATFSTAMDPDFDISGIKLDGASESDISVGEIQAASTNGNVTVIEVSSGTGVFVNADKAIDTASDNAIGAFDALQALRLAVGLDNSDGTSEWHDYIAADINKDGRVGADDALNILKFAVGLTDGPSADWVFVNGDADHSGIDRSNTDYDEGILISDVMTDMYTNMTGILVGDVSGSYIA